MKQELSPIQDEIVIYQSEDGNVKVDVLFQDETVWLSQEQMALLFGKGRTTITEHISNIFSEGELQEDMVCRKFRHTTQHGAIEGLHQTKEVKYYNLDVIISVGYRVKSRQGTMFRIWATQRLRDYAQALAHRPMYMKDWKERLDLILKLNERNVLEGPGKISHELAIEKAESEYMRYKEIEKEHIHLESIKELDKDIRLLNNK